MGREMEIKEKVFNKGKKNEKKIKVKLFPWEELNYVENLKKEFGLNTASKKSSSKKGAMEMA